MIQQAQVKEVQSIRQVLTIQASQARHDLQTISDSQLYSLSKEYGKSARKLMREFGFLLPEVYKRMLYRKYRCSSIHMFAAKLAGMNCDITNRILNLSEKLRDMPLLWQEFRKFGWTKLAVIANVATVETEKFWLDKLRKLPTLVLREYVRKFIENNKKCELTKAPVNFFIFVDDEKDKSETCALNKPQSSGTLGLVNEFTDRDAAVNIPRDEMSDFQRREITSFQGNIAAPSFRKLKFRVDPETEFEFKKFKQKMEKERKIELTMGETLKALLKKVKELETTGEKINREKSVVQSVNISQKDMPQKFVGALVTDTSKNPTISRHGGQTRHIPNEQKRSIVNKYNSKCAFPGCNEPYSELHHPYRFSIKKSHEKIYPLCRTHHQAAHAGLIKNEDKPVEQWKLDFESGPSGDSYENKDLENLIDPKDLNSVFVAYEKFSKNFADARVREYFDG